jgi:hypothetical protein
MTIRAENDASLRFREHVPFGVTRRDELTHAHVFDVGNMVKLETDRIAFRTLPASTAVFVGVRPGSETVEFRQPGSIEP